MRKHIFLAGALMSALAFTACSSDDDAPAGDFVVAFENPSVSFEPEDETKTIKLVFSGTAPQNGNITLNYTTTGAIYGEDFSTDPAGEEGAIEVSVAAGTSSSEFVFKKLQTPLEGEEKSVSFDITAVDIPNGYAQGNTTVQVSLTDSPAKGGQMAPEVGGPNEPNQVYVNLSAQRQTHVRRDSWDLAFYSGNNFRVALNGSVYMAAAGLDFWDIDTVTEADVAELQEQVAVGTFDPENMAYVDAPNGDIHGTAIAEVSQDDADNKVYLLNLGYAVGTETPETGSVAITGEHRGWMKIRILRSGEDYVLQYAGLNDTTHQTATISKDTNFNFTFFSFDSDATVSVESEKTKWDLNFTVFTDEIPGYGSYGYADFIAANNMSGVQGYLVETSVISYADFSAGDIDENSFDSDCRFIGSQWRVGGGPDTLPSLAEGLFFVLRDTDGQTYKLRFTALVNEAGVRGYPAFEYALVE